MGETTSTPKLTLESLRKEHPEIIEALRMEIENDSARKEAQAQQEKKLAETEKASKPRRRRTPGSRRHCSSSRRGRSSRAKVKASTLPEISKTRVAEALAKDPVVKDGKIDETAYAAKIEAAIKSEAEYLANLGAGKGLRDGRGRSCRADQDARRD